MKLFNLLLTALLLTVGTSSYSQTKNGAPQINSLMIDGKKSPSIVPLNPGEKYLIKVSITDPEGDQLTAKWELYAKSELFEAVEKKRQPIAIPDMVTGSLENVMLDVPMKPGTYRLVLTVRDKYKNSSNSAIELRVL